MASIVRYVFAVVALVAVTSAMLQLPECDRKSCDCPEPNVLPGDLKPVENDNGTCVCTCGRKLNDLCDDDKHCAKGTFCGAPVDITVIADKTKGVCTDRCKRKKCPAFHECVISESGDAECLCQEYDCETGTAKTPAYKAEQEGRIMNFENMCHTVNMNCQLKKNNPNAQLWTFVPDHSHEVSFSGNR